MADQYLLLVRTEGAREGCVHVNLVRQTPQGVRSGLLYGQMTPAALDALQAALGVAREEAEAREAGAPPPPPSCPRKRPRPPAKAVERGRYDPRR